MLSPLRKVVSRELGCVLGAETLECGHSNRLIPLTRNGIVRWYASNGRITSTAAKARRCVACRERKESR